MTPCLFSFKCSQCFIMHCVYKVIMEMLQGKFLKSDQLSYAYLKKCKAEYFTCSNPLLHGLHFSESYVLNDDYSNIWKRFVLHDWLCRWNARLCSGIKNLFKEYIWIHVYSAFKINKQNRELSIFYLPKSLEIPVTVKRSRTVCI